MNIIKRIDKRSNGVPARRLGVCCRTRAPPTALAMTISTVSRRSMKLLYELLFEWPPEVNWGAIGGGK